MRPAMTPTELEAMLASRRPSLDSIVRMKIEAALAQGVDAAQSAQSAAAAAADAEAAVDDVEAVVSSATTKADAADDKATAALARLTVAVRFPSYPIANLPSAADNPKSMVIVEDNPQGLARSAPMGPGVWHWLSEVDGSDLGPGNA